MKEKEFMQLFWLSARLFYESKRKEPLNPNNIDGSLIVLKLYLLDHLIVVAFWLDQQADCREQHDRK